MSPDLALIPLSILSFRFFMEFPPLLGAIRYALLCITVSSIIPKFQPLSHEGTKKEIEACFGREPLAAEQLSIRYPNPAICIRIIPLSSLSTVSSLCLEASCALPPAPCHHVNFFRNIRVSHAIRNPKSEIPVRLNSFLQFLLLAE
jgi:hypothetical protein